MAFFGLFNRKSLTRTIAWQDSWMTGGSTPSHRSVGGDRALTVIPVYAAVTLIAEVLATLPLQVFQETDQGISKRIKTPPLIAKPDVTMFRVSWLIQMMVSLLLRGNAYGLITGPISAPTGVKWIHPDSMRVDETGVAPLYFIGGASKGVSAWPFGPILHIPGIVQPGKWVGLSPVANFKREFETYEYAVDYGRNFFENSAQPSGILKNDQVSLDAEQARVVKTRFMENMNSNEPLVLDKNYTWQKISLSPDEAQFLATIKASATQIAAIFRVDADDIGGEANSGRKYSNREQDATRWNLRTLLPWTIRIEEALSELLPPGQYVKFNLAALTRPDAVTNTSIINTKLKNGTMTQDEARALDEKPPLTDEEHALWLIDFATLRSDSSSESHAVSESVVKD